MGSCWLENEAKQWDREARVLVLIVGKLLVL